MSDRIGIPQSTVTLWTVGHSNRTAEALIELLTGHGVARVIDVRAAPRSRRHPHFNRDALQQTLAASDIAYEHWKALGGLRKPRSDSPNTGLRHEGFRAFADYMSSAECRDALDRLLARARDDALALMCAEADPGRCHRALIADALTLAGAQVRHIRASTAAEPHALNPGVRSTPEGPIYPPAGESLPLF